MKREFDVIVVGAGPAGSAASLTLARKGVNVLMLEKSKVPGERNMSGGVLYGVLEGGYDMTGLIPDFERTAPLQRRIVSHEVEILGEPDMKSGTSRFYRLTRGSLAARLGFLPTGFETGHDFSVLRRPFDLWFAEKAVEAGATLSAETAAEGLLIEGGAVVGVRTSKEELRAGLIIDASGVTSALVQEAGLRGALTPRQLYHGTKLVFKLDSATIERRFRTKPGEGRATLFGGSFMLGTSGWAFIYTNTDTLSVGLVVSLDSLIRLTTERFRRVGKLIDIEDEFLAHPVVADLLEGAEAVEYSVHNMPKGFKCLPRMPYSDGFMVAGDALGACVKMGPMVDGMRYAIASGMMAATAYLVARESGSYRSRNLSRYRSLLAPVYDDVSRSGRESFVSESSVAQQLLPRLAFGVRSFSETYRFKPSFGGLPSEDALRRISERMSLLSCDRDVSSPHVEVDLTLASKSVTKPWAAICPANCFTVVTAKGVFASFRDVYEQNLELQSKESQGLQSARRKALLQTKEDVADAELRYDPSSCLSCGSCGAVGPAEIVLFRHDRDSRGVRYRYG